METFDVIKEALVENLGIAEEDISEDSTLESLGIDSLDMVELIVDVEEKLDIDFGEPEGIETIGQMIEYIESL